MDRETLYYKNPLYDVHVSSWNFYRLAYDGGRDFISASLVKHPLETQKNYETRLTEGICFNYSAAIIDLFSFYLTERSPLRHLKNLEIDAQWMMFEKDCDLMGTDFDTFLNNTQKVSSVYGSAGILVNKASSNSQNLDQEITWGIYPYCSVYTMSNIYDWQFKKNITSNRPELVYLKLKESDPGVYTIWTKEQWETWELPDEVDNGGIDPITGGSIRSSYGAGKNKANLIGRGKNILNEIPFIWMPNIKNIYTPYMGISDIREISYITASIIRNLSHGEEVIKFAGFPMLRRPMKQEGEEGKDEGVGVRAVQEFPPDFPNAKPDWMEAAIAEPIEAVLRWIDRKTDETYRIAHLSGVHGQRKSNNEVSSGLALRYEFQQLNSVLLQKSNNMSEAEMSIIRLWLKWQNNEEKFKEIEITRSSHFSIDDLSINLENIVQTMANVESETFKKHAQKQLAKVALPDLSDSDFKQIEVEISQAETVNEADSSSSGEPAE